MTYYFQDRFEFNKSTKTLESTSVEEITSFFQLLYQEKKDDGTLKEKEREKLKKEVRAEINKELAAARKRRQERGFSRDRYSHGRGHGYYQPDDRHKNERKFHNDIKTEKVKKEGCKYHGPDARHSTEDCHKNPANMKVAANKRDSRKDDSHHIDARYRTDSEDDHNSKGGDTEMNSTSEGNGSRSDSNDMNDSGHSAYHMEDSQKGKTLTEATKRKVTFVPRKKEKRSMRNDSSFVSNLFCNPLDFTNK